MNDEFEKIESLSEAVEIGHALRKARKSKQLSINDIASHLRLRETLIESIEQGQYPEDVLAYIKGYIRAYGKLVDLDETWISEQVGALTLCAPDQEYPIKVQYNQGWSKVISDQLSWKVVMLVSATICVILAKIFQNPIDEDAHIQQLVEINQPVLAEIASDQLSDTQDQAEPELVATTEETEPNNNG